VKIGDFNRLKIARETSIGLFLEDELGMEVLLPKRYQPESFSLGDELEVFIYRDSEDRLIATSERPSVRVNQFGVLEVAQVTSIGGFMDWGLPKDLFVPLKEQSRPLNPGDKCLVYVYLDRLTQRLVGTTKLDKHLSDKPFNLEKGSEVNLRIWDNHELGYKVVIDDEYAGMIYHNQLFEALEIGQLKKGYVNEIRDNGKIDVLLSKPGAASIGDDAQLLLGKLSDSEGFIQLNDRSKPEEIKKELKMSKKAFKRAIGSLYKQRLIEITDNGIKLK